MLDSVYSKGGAHRICRQEHCLISSTARAVSNNGDGGIGFASTALGADCRSREDIEGKGGRISMDSCNTSVFSDVKTDGGRNRAGIKASVTGRSNPETKAGIRHTRAEDPAATR